MDEVKVYAKAVNFMLKGDEDCQQFIPVSAADLLEIFDTGVVLCKLILIIKSEALDTKKITKAKNINRFQSTVNINLALEGAR